MTKMARFNQDKKVLFIMKNDSVVMEDVNVLFDNMSNMVKFRDENTFCDVVLCVPKQNQPNSFDELHAHSCILAGVSGLFHEVLRKSEIYRQSSKRLYFENIDFEMLKMCIDFMYGSSLTVRHCNLTKLKQAADVFKIESLVKHCILCMEMVEMQQQSKQDKQDNDQNDTVVESTESVDDKYLQEISVLIQDDDDNDDHIEENLPANNIIGAKVCNKKSDENKTHVDNKVKSTVEMGVKKEHTIGAQVHHKKCMEVSTHDKVKSTFETSKPSEKTLGAQVHNKKSMETRTDTEDKVKSTFEMSDSSDDTVESNTHDDSYSNETSIHDNDDTNRPDDLIFETNVPDSDAIETTVTHDSDSHETRICDKTNSTTTVKGNPADSTDRSELRVKDTENLLKPKALLKAIHDAQKMIKNQVQFVCDICGKVLKSKSNLKFHKKYLHKIGCTNLEIFKCPECSYSSHKIILLQTHMTRVHEKNRPRYECHICGKYYYAQTLQQHMQDVHKVGLSQEVLQRRAELRKGKNQRMNERRKQPQICQHCGVTFKNYQVMRTHLKVVKGKAFLCQYCSRTFHSKRTLEWHEEVCKDNVNKLQETGRNENRVKSNVPKKQIQKKSRKMIKNITNSENLEKATYGDSSLVCDICGKYYARKVNLTTHMLVKHKIGLENAKIHKCPHCPYTHPILSTFKYHVSTHQRSRDYKCAKCEKCYFTKYGLNNHIKVIHEKVRPPPEVMEKLRVKQRKWNRAIYEKNKQPQVCEHCGVTFRNYRALRVHLRGLEGKLFPCKYCPRVCVSPATLRLHIKRHKGEKNFQCEKCDYSAVSQTAITKHQYLHEDTRSSTVCDICGKGYKLARSLQIHKQRAHGLGRQELMKCPQCPYTHPQASTVRGHMLSHQDTREKVCTVCGKAYKRMHSLRRHMEEAHNTVIPTEQNKSVLFQINEDSNDQVIETATRVQNQQQRLFPVLTQTQTLSQNVMPTSTSNLVTQCVEYDMADDDIMYF